MVSFDLRLFLLHSFYIYDIFVLLILFIIFFLIDFQLPEMVFKTLGSSLVSLNITRSGLREFDFLQLKKFPKLQELNLSYNKLSDLNGIKEFMKVIGGDSFKLNLRNNKLKLSNSARFNDFLEILPYMKEIDLSNNLIKTIPIEFAKGIKENQGLSISFKGNPIKSVLWENAECASVFGSSADNGSCITFPMWIYTLDQVEDMNIRNCNLQGDLKLYDFIQNMKLLESLDLSMNRITSLDKKSCSMIPENHSLHAKLKHLIMSKNILTSISGTTFAKMPKLSSITLDKNEIIKIDNDAFIGLKEIQELNMRGNKLQSLDFLSKILIFLI